MMNQLNKSRGIGLNKNAANVQQQPLQPLQPLQPTQNLKRLTQLKFSEFKNILNDENAHEQKRLAQANAKQPKLLDLDEKPRPTATVATNANTNTNTNITAAAKPSAALKSLIPVPTDKLTEIEDIDKSTSSDALFSVSHVAKDIYQYMNDLESAQAIKEDPLKLQKTFTPKVRSRLINWCIEVNSKLKLLPETMYMTVSLIDRYFEKTLIDQQNQVQLVAVGAILIASKYEEIYPPDVADLIYLTQNTYSRKEIFKIEINILETLDFNLGKPIPLAFFRRFSKAAHCDLKMHSMGKYFMELSLTEYECCHWKPSLLAAAALFTTLHLVHGYGCSPTHITTRFGSITTPRVAASIQKDPWTRSIVHYTNYTREQLQKPAAILCKILKKALKSPSSYHCVKQQQPKWPELKSPRVDHLIKLAEN